MSGDVVVVGAGPAGLGAASMLKRRGWQVQVLERGPAVGAKWRAGYDSLRLNTSALLSHLPGMRLTSSGSHWPTRDEFTEHMERYVAVNALDVCTGVDVNRLDRIDGRWRATTGNGELMSDAVLVATGKDIQPSNPLWPGVDSFTGRLLHAREYREASGFAGLDVLVVGSGNSAMDIAMDAVNAAAKTVRISVRTPPHIVRRSTFGIPFDVLSVTTAGSPVRIRDASAKLLRRLTVGDLGAFGFPVPADGPVARINRTGAVPMIERGDFAAALRSRAIEAVAAVQHLDGDHVVLADGTQHRTDVVVAAIGYRPDLQGLVGHLGVLDDAGYPRSSLYRPHPSLPLIRFLGFVESPTGLLRQIRLDARQAAKSLTKELRTANR